MPLVSFEGSDREALKRLFKVWAGSEAMQLGFGRRSGVPALVAIDERGQEVAFVDAERRGPSALHEWPKAAGVWGG